jgi:hypothetical protein
MFFTLETFAFKTPNYCHIHYTLTDILLAVFTIFHIAVFKQGQVAALILLVTFVTTGLPDFQCVNLSLSLARALFPLLA